MIIHTVLICEECKFCWEETGHCNYHDRTLPDRRVDISIPDWCELRTNSVLVMTDPNKLRKAEETPNEDE